MRFLKEAFGESEELNTFVAQAQRRFPEYWEVRFTLDNSVKQSNYYAYEPAAIKAYNEMLKDVKQYYDKGEVTLDKITVNLSREEIKSEFVWEEDEE